MNALIGAALDRARTVLTAFALLLVAGLYAYVTIPKESSPDIDIPIIYVSMTHEGISPEDAERLLVRPMEVELRAIEGVKEMRAMAYEGGANVVLEFEAGFDAEQALLDVREKVDLAEPELPEETDEPRVHEVNFSLFPVLTVTLSGDVPERTLLTLARQLRDDLRALPPVLDVTIGGDREELVEIVIDPMKLESYRLDAQQVIEFVGRSNRLVAAGALDTGRGRFAIKVPGLIETAADILDLPLKVNGDAVVRVRDVAELRSHFKDRQTVARVDGKPAVTLEVKKRTGENIIGTIEAVRTLVEAQRTRWPPAVQVKYTQDQSSFIRTMLGDLQNNVISAVLLVMIFVVGALGLRSGLLVGVAIPASFLAGILVLYAGGLTVNMVVLFSLILAVGMLVDGAIVVTEFADRKMLEGLRPRDAYRMAVQRMAWPIISSTATTLAAFLPLLFWPGVVGEFMKFLPITLLATLTASLVTALIFVPVLGAIFGRPSASDAATMKAIAGSEAGDLRELRGFTGLYARMLSRALRHPGKILIAAVVVLVGSWTLYGAFGKGVEFFPQGEPNLAVLQIHGRGNLSVAEKDALVAEVEREVLRLQAERGEFASVYTLAGNREVRDDEAEDIIGTITLEFADWQARRPADAILADIRARTAGLAGILVETRKQENGPPVGKPIHVQVSAADPASLEQATRQVRAYLDGMPGLRDVDDSLPLPGIEWRMSVDRAQAAKFGADVTAVGQMVRLVTNGLIISTYRPDGSDDEIDIVVRFPTADRGVDRLDELRIQTAKGLVPIANFVERTPQPRTGLLRRADGQRVAFVRANVDPGVLADDKVQEIRAWLAEEAELPAGVEVTFKGEDEEQREAAAFLQKAFVVALFLIAMILVTQFNSFYNAALVLTAVVMSTVGVLLGLLLIGQPFSIVMSGIGVIALAGIVVNNNIVLIDTYDHLRSRLGESAETIVRTCAQRLRPVLLTSVTTALGLLPMMLQMNIDFFTREVSIGAPSTAMWVQLATAIGVGLGFATVLTLLVTPSALMLQLNLRQWHRRWRGLPTTAAPETGPAPPPRMAAE